MLLHLAIVRTFACIILSLTDAFHNTTLLQIVSNPDIAIAPPCMRYISAITAFLRVSAVVNNTH